MTHLESEEESDLVPEHFLHDLSHDFVHKLLHEAWGKIYNYAHIVAHGAYFAAVYLEGHGVYSLCGGALFILLVWGVLGGFSND